MSNKTKPGEKGPETETSKAPAPAGDQNPPPPSVRAAPDRSRLPADHRRPTVDEYVAKGYRLEAYEATMVDWEWELVEDAEREAARKKAADDARPPPPKHGPSAPPGLTLPALAPKKRLPPGYVRPTLEEYLAKGNPEAWYEYRMRVAEWKLVEQFETEKANRPRKPQPPPKENRASKGRVLCSVLKNIHVDSMVVRAGGVAYVPRENVRRLERLGAVKAL